MEQAERLCMCSYLDLWNWTCSSPAMWELKGPKIMLLETSIPVWVGLGMKPSQNVKRLKSWRRNLTWPPKEKRRNTIAAASHEVVCRPVPTVFGNFFRWRCWSWTSVPSTRHPLDWFNHVEGLNPRYPDPELFCGVKGTKDADENTIHLRKIDVTTELSEERKCYIWDLDPRGITRKGTQDPLRGESEKENLSHGRLKDDGVNATKRDSIFQKIWGDMLHQSRRFFERSDDESESFLWSSIRSYFRRIPAHAGPKDHWLWSWSIRDNTAGILRRSGDIPLWRIPFIDHAPKQTDSPSAQNASPTICGW